mgnify:CR=1 FL=1
MNLRRIIVIAGMLALLAGASVLGQLPAGPTAGPNAQVPQSPTSVEQADPEQEGTNDVNRILRDLRLIKRFFQLTDAQMDAIRPEIEATYPDLLALYRDLHMLRQELRELMTGASPPPGQVGQLIVDIREIEIEIAEIRQTWGDAIEGVLDDDQKARLERVRQLTGILPAFRGVGLIPPPPGPPKE